MRVLPTRALLYLAQHRSCSLLYSAPAFRFLDQFQVPYTTTTLSMADTFSAVSDVSATEDEAVKFGFKRDEMFSKKLTGSVDPYDRHVFLCYKTPDDWASHVESSDIDPFPKLFSSAVRARKDDITVKMKLTIFAGGEECLDGDVLIFPEMIKYKGLKDSDVDSFVDDVLVNGKPWASGVQEVLSGSYIFVCAHGSRDKRCGVCGPPLIEKLKEEIELRELKHQLFVNPCSHIGGHKYAGNLIIFGPNLEGKISGHWFGYVTPEDVPELLDEHIAKGVIIERLWRGQMGTSTEDGKKNSDQKTSNGTEVSNGTVVSIGTEIANAREGANGRDDNKSENHVENNILTKSETAFSGCCQGTNGVSCCRDGNSEVSEEKKLKETIQGEGKKKLASWFESWEAPDVYAAAAVVGAVATVAVAYSLYIRRSG